MKHDLLELLTDLRGVQQDPAYHPERDALYHSLQSFDLARRETDDRQLWAAALLHDVGKAYGGRDHDRVGARLLHDLLAERLAPRVIWLVEHHLDLLRHPRRARRRYRGSQRLRDLELLRRWDLGGRDPHARVLSPRAAVELLLERPELLRAQDRDMSCDSYELERRG